MRVALPPVRRSQSRIDRNASAAWLPGTSGVTPPLTWPGPSASCSCSRRTCSCAPRVRLALPYAGLAAWSRSRSVAQYWFTWSRAIHSGFVGVPVASAIGSIRVVGAKHWLSTPSPGRGSAAAAPITATEASRATARAGRARRIARGFLHVGCCRRASTYEVALLPGRTAPGCVEPDSVSHDDVWVPPESWGPAEPTSPRLVFAFVGFAMVLLVLGALAVMTLAGRVGPAGHSFALPSTAAEIRDYEGPRVQVERAVAA